MELIPEVSEASTNGMEYRSPEHISPMRRYSLIFFFFQAEDGIRDVAVTGVQTCALPIFAIERLGAVACGENGRALAWIQKRNTRWSQKKFIAVSRPWLRFLGWWRELIEIGRASCRERV